jgi:chaperone BCS1
MFMTTNHLGKLDPALVRPGRVDIAQLIDDARPIQAQLLFTQFYGGSHNVTGISDSEVQALALRLHDIVAEEMLVGRRVSMAALQGHFIRHEARDALVSCQELFSLRPVS